MVIISPVLGFRPCRDARLRASKLPKPVICTFVPFFSSPAMMPLSSNRASIARVASALDILVRMASAAVSSALFTVPPCEGLGLENPCNGARFAGGHEKTRMKPPQYGVPPRKSARLGHFLDPLRRPRYPSPPIPRYPSHSKTVLLSYSCNVQRATCNSVVRMFYGTRPGWIEVIAGVMFS